MRTMIGQPAGDKAVAANADANDDANTTAIG
jgi:hypothetical protein